MKYRIILPSVLLSVFLFSCRNKEPQYESGQVFEAVHENADDTWNPGDRIMVYQDSGIYSDFIYSGDKPVRTAFFSGNIDGYSESMRHMAVYPSSSARGYDKGMLYVKTDETCAYAPAVSAASGTQFRCKNVCGCIRLSLVDNEIKRITITGNDGETLAGVAAIVFDSAGNPVVSSVTEGCNSVYMDVPDGTAFSTDRDYLFQLLPGEYGKGVTITFEKNGSRAVKEVRYPLTIGRNSFVSIYSADSGLEYEPFGEVTDLSAAGASNCYIVTRKGNFKFKATVKGPGFESLASPSAASVLWESYGTDEEPVMGSLVSEVTYSDGYISFFASGKNGNAVIAVKDAAGEILWSWHIWICSGYDPSENAQQLNTSGSLMMDRNLGATSSAAGSLSSLGLLYQWGRKDPFPGAATVSSTSKPAATTAPWPDPVLSDEACGTLEYASSHPMTFILGNDKNMDWLYTGSYLTDNTRWRVSGSMEKKDNDPCPPGWRVPDLYPNTGTFWAAAFGANDPRPSGPWLEESQGMDFGCSNGMEADMQLGIDPHIWYPAAGYINGSDGSLAGVGECGRYHSSWCDTRYSRFLMFNASGYVFPQYMGYRSYAASIRCISL